MIILYLIIACVLTSLSLHHINKKQLGIDGAPAWLLTVVVCLAVAIVITLLPGGWPFEVQWILVLASFVFFGANAVFNLVLKGWARVK